MPTFGSSADLVIDALFTTHFSDLGVTMDTISIAAKIDNGTAFDLSNNGTTGNQMIWLRSDWPYELIVTDMFDRLRISITDLASGEKALAIFESGPHWRTVKGYLRIC